MLAAGYARMRPVLMTATAMILGMLPMALGLGEGGEQNAPLGRAVIGGLMFATVTTLFVVPIIYSYLRTKPPVDHLRKLAERERGRSLMRYAEPDPPLAMDCRDNRGAASQRKSRTPPAARGVEKARALRTTADSLASFVDHHLGHLSGSGDPHRCRFPGGLYSAAEATGGGGRDGS